MRKGLANSKGLMRTTLRAVVLKAVSLYGRAGAAKHLGIGARTIHLWLTDWKVEPYVKVTPSERDISVLAEFLGLQRKLPPKPSPQPQPKPVAPPIQTEPRVVYRLPPDLREQIEAATEFLLTANNTAALDILLGIRVEDHEKVDDKQKPAAVRSRRKQAYGPRM